MTGSSNGESGRVSALEAVRAELLAAYDAATPVTAEGVQAAGATPATAESVAADGLVTAPGAAISFTSIDGVLREPTTWLARQRIPTNICSLDNVLLGGFTKGDVHLLAGKAGQCKTQLLSQLAVNVAFASYTVLFLSLEMSNPEVVRLMVAQQTGVPRVSLGKGLDWLQCMAPQQYQDTANGIRRLRGLPLMFTDNSAIDGGWSRHDISRAVDQAVAQFGCRFVVLDHLGELVPAAEDGSASTAEIDKRNIRELRQVAQRHNLALVVVSTLRKSGNSRDAAKRGLQLDDIMGSAGIGYAASTCVIVTAQYEARPGDSTVSVRVAKNRYGPTPAEPITLTWEPPCGRIYDGTPRIGGTGV